MSGPVVIRNCHDLAEFYACVALQREIWGEEPLEVEPATMFVVAAHTGGQVIGAFDGDELVGFVLAVAGVRDGRAYLHSHMAGVREGYRNQGLGRKLKLFQREEALRRGITLIEWTFDPLEVRNAHFNLNRLGAICRQYRPNLYGVTTSPLHHGLATDRLVAEWHLDSTRVVAAIGGLAKEPVDAPVAIELPAGLEYGKREDARAVAEAQAKIREEFLKWFAKGYAAVGMRTGTPGNAYLLG